MKQKTFEPGEQVTITQISSRIISKRPDGKYLVHGFAYPIGPDNLKKVKPGSKPNKYENIARGLKRSTGNSKI